MSPEPIGGAGGVSINGPAVILPFTKAGGEQHHRLLPSIGSEQNAARFGIAESPMSAQQPVADADLSGQSNQMSNGPTREEIDAKLSAAEARTETRFAELNGKLDRIGDQLERLADGVSQTRADNKNTRITIIVTVIASAIALWGAVISTQSALLTAFQTAIAVKTLPAPPPSATQGVPPK